MNPAPPAAASTLQLHGQHGTDPRSGARRTLPQLLFDQAAALGDATYLRAKRHGVWRRTSWRQFADEVATLARAFLRFGLNPGDVVAVASENLPEVYAVEYATQSVGAAVTCMYPDASAAELAYVLTHSQARILFAEDQEQVDKALSIAPAPPMLELIVFIDGRGLWDYADPRLRSYRALRDDGAASDPALAQHLHERIAAGRDEAAAAICYTSGTTGKPKGVVLTHRYLLDNAYRLIASFGMPRHIQYLSYISPAWAAEQITGLGLTLLAPAVVNFAEQPETVAHDLREIGPQFLLFTPRQWEMMSSSVDAAMMDARPWRQRLFAWATRVGQRCRGSARWPDRLRLALADRLILRAIRDNLGLKDCLIPLSAGSGMSAEVFRRFHAVGVPLRNLYGSTEFGLVSAHWGAQFDPETMGQLLLVDPAVGAPIEALLQPAGQLLVKGASGFGGYYRDAEATAAVLAGEHFQTGDCIRVAGADQLVFLDRYKDLRTLAGGAWFPPQFIENQLRASPFVRDAIAIGDAQREFVTTLINIDAQIVGRYAESHGIGWSTYADLSQQEQVHRLLQQTLRALNEKLDPAARVRRFATFPKELDADDEELTRSRKLKRNVIEERYAPVIAAMYGGAATCSLRVPVKYQDGTEATIDARVRITEI